MKKSEKKILWWDEISIKDVPLVGGKNASLGEMYSHLSKRGVRVPFGFALTSQAYWYFLEKNNINRELEKLFKKSNLERIEVVEEVSKKAMNMILKGEFPLDLKKEIIKHYHDLGKKYGEKNLRVAVRSSATAEDLPSASFAGQQETYLNVSGDEALLKAIKKCIASLFTARAIAYREEKGFDHLKVALSVGIQKMVRSDLGSSGVMFTLDTESGFRNVIVINSIFGVGEMIVKGKITPDTFYVFKPTLSQKRFDPIIIKNLGRKNVKYIFSSRGGLKEMKVSPRDRERFSLLDKEVIQLAQWGLIIERYYKKPQDIEWAKDGKTGELFIVQARPETVYGARKKTFYEEYSLKVKEKPILEGIAIGNKVSSGKVRVIKDVSKISEFKAGEILVTRMTDPDWVPAMRIARGIITDEGGKTCHAAIISRELGIPAIVGTGSATKILKTGQEVTVDCTRGLEGRVFKGKISFKIKKYNLERIPKLKAKIMVNIGAPEIAFKTSFLPVDGVGLAREEFIIAEKIRIHPLALYHYEKIKRIKSKKIKEIVRKIDDLTFGYKDKKRYFIDKLSEGISQIAAAFYPRKVIVRFSDFKSNEYKNLIGGEIFEKNEDNPMLGFRGACRYLDPGFQPAFQMELEAIKKVREIHGLKNVMVMVPFCRTVEEGRKVLRLIDKSGLKRKNELKVYVMCEIPSNVILVDKFLDIFDGMSIGSNDLTQLTLGLDRDNGRIAYVGDERNEAVKEMIKRVIRTCRRRKKYSGICGQAPSDFPEFAEFLMKEGIESISLNPDTVIKTILKLSKK